MSQVKVQVVWIKYLVLVFLLSSYLICANPIRNRRVKRLKQKKVNKTETYVLPVPPAELFQFFRQFGYLEKTPGISESLYHEDAIVQAIKNMQLFGGLPQTGELNDETLKLLNAPRCGMPDIMPNNATMTKKRRKRYVVGGLGWRKRTITYFIANWSPKVGTPEKIATDMRRAFDIWAHYGNLKFIETNDPQADIIVSFGSGYHGDNYPFDGPGNILAHAFYPYEDPYYGGDIHFDNDENWVDGARSLHEGVDFLSVAIHELGHSMGLAHSYHPEAVMFPYYRGGTGGHAVQYDDILGMYELYVKNAPKADESTTIPYQGSTNAVTQSTPTRRRVERRRTTTTTTEVPVSTETIPETSTERILLSSMPDKPMPTFEGDYETVDKHKERFTLTPVLYPTTSSMYTHEYTSSYGGITHFPVENEIEPVPDICHGKFDAASTIRGEVFIFKDAYVWRLNRLLKVVEGYPTLWRDLFAALPENVHKIDAVYERQTDNAIVFFVGKQYYVFDGIQLIENSPQPITNYGIDSSVEKVDAVMTWAKNDKTYIFSGNHFWRYNDERKFLDIGYPKTMDRWYGIPGDLDAALTLRNRKTYFFKDNKYWLFNNKWVRPESGYPRKASKVWLGCK